MCFFHVLYNAHNRLRSFDSKAAAQVYKGIYDMHFAETPAEFVSTKERVFWERKERWGFTYFARYIEQQWLNGKY